MAPLRAILCAFALLQIPMLATAFPAGFEQDHTTMPSRSSGHYERSVGQAQALTTYENHGLVEHQPLHKKVDDHKLYDDDDNNFDDENSHFTTREPHENAQAPTQGGVVRKSSVRRKHKATCSLVHTTTKKGRSVNKYSIHISNPPYRAENCSNARKAMRQYADWQCKPEQRGKQRSTVITFQDFEQRSPAKANKILGEAWFDVRFACVYQRKSVKQEDTVGHEKIHHADHDGERQEPAAVHLQRGHGSRFLDNKRENPEGSGTRQSQANSKRFFSFGKKPRPAPEPPTPPKHDSRCDVSYIPDWKWAPQDLQETLQREAAAHLEERLRYSLVIEQTAEQHAHCDHAKQALKNSDFLGVNCGPFEGHKQATQLSFYAPVRDNTIAADVAKINQMLGGIWKQNSFVCEGLPWQTIAEKRTYYGKMYVRTHRPDFDMQEEDDRLVGDGRLERPPSPQTKQKVDAPKTPLFWRFDDVKEQMVPVYKRSLPRRRNDHFRAPAIDMGSTQNGDTAFVDHSSRPSGSGSASHDLRPRKGGKSKAHCTVQEISGIRRYTIKFDNQNSQTERCSQAKHVLRYNNLFKSQHATCTTLGERNTIYLKFTDRGLRGPMRFNLMLGKIWLETSFDCGLPSHASVETLEKHAEDPARAAKETTSDSSKEPNGPHRNTKRSPLSTAGKAKATCSVTDMTDLGLHYVIQIGHPALQSRRCAHAKSMSEEKGIVNFSCGSTGLRGTGTIIRFIDRFRRDSSEFNAKLGLVWTQNHFDCPQIASNSATLVQHESDVWEDPDKRKRRISGAPPGRAPSRVDITEVTKSVLGSNQDKKKPTTCLFHATGSAVSLDVSVQRVKLSQWNPRICGNARALFAKQGYDMSEWDCKYDRKHEVIYLNAVGADWTPWETRRLNLSLGKIWEPLTFTFDCAERS